MPVTQIRKGKKNLLYNLFEHVQNSGNYQSQPRELPPLGVARRHKAVCLLHVLLLF